MIISGTELKTYFGKDKTPTQMKEKILELREKEFKPQERDAAKTEKKPSSRRNSPHQAKLARCFPALALYGSFGLFPIAA